RDIWVRLTQRLMAHFGEDRRIEYKGNEKINFDDFATYLSAFSNSPDGGTIVFGADSLGTATGCGSLPQRLTGRTWATSKKDLDRLARKNLLTFVPGAYTRDPKAHYIVNNVFA